VVELVMANPYANPRPLEAGGVRRLLENAYFGRPPGG
jgi:hypothetical protein